MSHSLHMTDLTLSKARKSSQLSEDSTRRNDHHVSRSRTVSTTSSWPLGANDTPMGTRNDSVPPTRTSFYSESRMERGMQSQSEPTKSTKHSNQNTQARLLMLHHGFFIFQNRNISIYIVLVVRLLGATWPERADLASCARCKNTKPWRWNCQKQRCRDQSYIIYPININQMISTSTVE